MHRWAMREVSYPALGAPNRISQVFFFVPADRVRGGLYPVARGVPGEPGRGRAGSRRKRRGRPCRPGGVGGPGVSRHPPAIPPCQDPGVDDLVRAIPSADLPTSVIGEPHIRRVSVGAVDVLLARLEERGVVAFAATCPHQETNLEAATFWDGKIRCPLHLYLYDPSSGENLIPARSTRPENLWKLKPGYLPIHRVEEHDGWILVSPTPNPPPEGFDPECEVRPRAGLRARRPELEARVGARPDGRSLGD